jgi:hypothetical protein
VLPAVSCACSLLHCACEHAFLQGTLVFTNDLRDQMHSWSYGCSKDAPHCSPEALAWEESQMVPGVILRQQGLGGSRATHSDMGLEAGSHSSRSKVHCLLNAQWVCLGTECPPLPSLESLGLNLCLSLPPLHVLPSAVFWASFHQREACGFQSLTLQTKCFPFSML